MRKITVFFLCGLAGLATLAVDASGQSLSLKKVKPEVIESRLRDCPRKNVERKDKLEELFRQAGCTADQLSEQTVKGTNEPNVICSLPGESESTILIGAHFDNDGSGRGVIDNWSGAALLPSLYQSMKSAPRKHKMIFIGFAGEELGLLGSEFYAKKMTREEVAQTRAMINVDCLGLETTAVQVNRGDAKLLEMLYRVAYGLQLPLRRVNTGRIGMTDGESFSHRKIPQVDFHSLTQTTLRSINSGFDQFGVVQWKEYYDSYQLIAAYLVYLDAKLD